eukprot:3660351-Amphidinium_carterae.1
MRSTQTLSLCSMVDSWLWSFGAGGGRKQRCRLLQVLPECHPCRWEGLCHSFGDNSKGGTLRLSMVDRRTTQKNKEA